MKDKHIKDNKHEPPIEARLFPDPALIKKVPIAANKTGDVTSILTAMIPGPDERTLPVEWIRLFQSINPIDGYYCPEPVKKNCVSFGTHDNP